MGNTTSHYSGSAGSYHTAHKAKICLKLLCGNYSTTDATCSEIAGQTNELREAVSIVPRSRYGQPIISAPVPGTFVHGCVSRGGVAHIPSPPRDILSQPTHYSIDTLQEDTASPSPESTKSKLSVTVHQASSGRRREAYITPASWNPSTPIAHRTHLTSGFDSEATIDESSEEVGSDRVSSATSIQTLSTDHEVPRDQHVNPPLDASMHFYVDRVCIHCPHPHTTLPLTARCQDRQTSDIYSSIDEVQDLYMDLPTKCSRRYT